MIIPDLSMTIVAGVIFLIVVVALNILIFKPLWGVMDEREARTSGLRKSADKLLHSYETAYHEYELRLKEGRQRGYKLSEESRRQALEERNQRLVEARGQAGQIKEQAKAELESVLESSRGALKAETKQIAELITSRVLQRQT